MHSTDSSMVDAELVSADIGELSSLSLLADPRTPRTLWDDRHSLSGYWYPISTTGRLASTSADCRLG